MEQALQQLEERFAQRLANRTQNLQDAQAALDNLIGVKEAKRAQIIAYYEAVAEKSRYDAIVNQGAPII